MASTSQTLHLSHPYSMPDEYLARVATFVRSHSELEGWTPFLFANSWILEIARNERWDAIVWYNYVTDSYDAIETHAVAAPTSRGRWVTRTALRAHEYILQEIGAEYATAQVTSPLAARIWKALGYHIEGDLAIRKI